MKNKICYSILLVFILDMFFYYNAIFAEGFENNIDDTKVSSSKSLIVETSNIKEVEKNSNVENVTEVAKNTYIVDYKNEETANEEINILENTNYIDKVLGDIKVSILDDEKYDTYVTTVDSNYLAWGVETTGMDHYTKYLDYKEKREVLVAVLDTGININHIVFKNSTNADRIDTSYSYNYVDNSSNITDDQGHGTKVASVIAESTPSNVKIIPVKVMNNEGEGNFTDIIKAMNNIKDYVDIINLSLGVDASLITDDNFTELENILKEIYDNGNGPVMVCASGNEATSDVIYPASSKYTIAVSALSKSNNGKLEFASRFSNYGDCIDFSAPGEGIYVASYKSNNSYVLSSGTSIATPFVSSALALIKTEYPTYNEVKLKQKLIENTDDLGDSGKDIYFGYGSINFITNIFEKPTVANIKKSNVTTTGCTIIADAVCDDSITKYAHIKNGETISTSNWINITKPSTNIEISFNITKNGTYYLYLMDEEGEISSTQFVVSEIASASQKSIKYRTHVQDVGWQSYVKDGALAGTIGKGLRLEGINISLESTDISGGVQYRTHVQNIGWQSYVGNGAMAGTSGKSLRLEAIQIALTGDIANYYDIYYRVHCQNFGWLGWAKNGEEAGSAGYSYRLEGIQIVLVKKGGTAPGSTSNCFKQNITYQTHIQNVGWQNNVNSPDISGTTGQSLRLEAIRIQKPSGTNISGNIQYSTHVQDIGWQGYVENGALAGTSGRSLRLEAIKIRLTGDLANKYDIYYRVHCQNFGWLGWAKNGEEAGSAGYSYRLEGIQIVLVKKGDTAPGSTTKTFIKK